MNKITIIIICIFLFPKSLFSQKDISSAKELYKIGEYEQAAELFKKIKSNKNLSKIYKTYFDCLIKIKEYKEASELSKNYYKKSGKNPSILIDLGISLSLNGNENEAITKYEMALNQAIEKPNFLLSVASKFYSSKLYLYALDAYTELKNKNPNSNYSFQISNIYSQLGQTENMYKELINLILTNESYIQTCKNKIRTTINNDRENENNLILKKILINNIQKNNSITLNEILIWLYLQEESFLDALNQEIALDKRNNDREREIFKLGNMSKINNNFEIAESAYSYLINKKNKSFYYEECIIQSLEIKYLIFKKRKTNNSTESSKIIKEFESKLDDIGITNESIPAIIQLSDILAFHGNNLEKAKSILNNVITKKTFTDENIAQCKIKLGDILLIEDDVWEAQLYYSQVEKSFKHDLIGQEAKFKKIKVDYYSGKFNWAKAQLDILKQSTSKLISNNSIELSLLISNNLNLDTTQIPLQLFAEGELLLFQNKYNEALKKFNTIEDIYPNHSLQDDILFHKASIEIKKNNYDLGITILDEICKNHKEETLYDNALFEQAITYDYLIEDYKLAQEKYKEILLECPASIFVPESRKRYRYLRNLID